MTDFHFTELLVKRGVDPGQCRLVRHDRIGRQQWLAGRQRFEHYVSFQKPDRSPYRGAVSVFHFLPDGGSLGLFIGAHEIGEARLAVSLGTTLHANVFDSTSPLAIPEGSLCHDLHRREDFEDLIGRIVIEWGAGTRSWSQWASNPKPIVEWRAVASEPDFPGFARFGSHIDDLLLLPASWQGALGSVKGVYLLVCPETGAQYVGSASGAGGFFERWLAYAADGHGGNRLLMARQRMNYAVSILEIASPEMSREDIIAREAAWKHKLGSRAHGLNAN